MNLVFEVKTFLYCCCFALASLEVFRWDIARNSLSNVSYSVYNNQWLLKKFKAEGSFSMRYPNALSLTVVDFAFSWWIKFISERNDSSWLMANNAFWLPCHCTFGTCKFSSHERRHKAFARCNKKFRGKNIPFPAFSSIFCLGDGWFTLTFVLNVLVYFPSFLFLD